MSQDSLSSHPPASDPASAFHYQRRVQFGDTDMAGFAHFSSLLSYMEEAEHAFFRSLGLSVFQKVGDEVLSWPRKTVRAEFHSPTHFDDVLDIAVEVEKIGKKSLTWQFRITLENRLIATGETVSIYCRFQPEPIKSVPIPAEIVRRLTEGGERKAEGGRGKGESGRGIK